MKKIKLFIADVDSSHIECISRCAAHRRDLEIVGTADNGNLALKQVTADPPDVLLMDIQLPGLDGIMLLKDLQREPRPPIAVVCTRFYSDICITNASKYGAQYFLYKPLDYNRLPEILVDCYRRARQRRQQVIAPEENTNVRRISAIRSLLAELGIPAKLTGSHYLIESMLSLDENGILLRNLSKGLYAEIAGRMNTTPSRVERSLRSAISGAYDRGCMREYFHHSPSNKEFIEFLLRRVQSDGMDEQ